MNANEMERVEKFQDLAREVQTLWSIRTKVIPTITGTLMTTPKKLPKDSVSLE